MATHGARNRLAEPRFGSVGAGSIPRSMGTALAQDRAGSLWIATGDGLVRYDGYHFRPQESSSLVQPASLCRMSSMFLKVCSNMES